jgi:Minichromosome loss protein, Mcl1, middle region
LGDALGEVFTLASITSARRQFLTKVQGRVNTVYSRGNTTAVGGNQETLVVLENELEKQVYEGNKASILNVSISPSGSFISVISQDGWLYIYSDYKLVKKSQISSKIKDDALEQFIGEFSPDGTKFGIPGDFVFRYLESPDWKYNTTTISCSKNISIVRWASNSHILTASLDNCIRLWNIFEDNQVLQQHFISSMPWDMIYTGDSLIVAMTNSHEIIKNIKIPAFCQEVQVKNESEADSVEKEELRIDKSFFDKVIGVYPQESIAPGISDKSFSILFRSQLGCIISREYYSANCHISKIEIEFDDLNFHSNINFSNTQDFCIGYMAANGVLLGSQVYEGNLDEFVSDTKSSCIFFRSFGSNMTWEVYLPSLEVPESLCISSCCAVYTSLNYLRLFNLGGIQTFIISMSGPIVCMASYDSELAMIYHNAAPVLGCQSLVGEIWYMNELSVNSEAQFFKEDFKVAVTPEEKILWMGYSDTGVLYTLDSSKVLRGFWRRAMSWIPLCTLQDYVRIVGIAEDQVMLNLTENYKVIELQDFSIPICKTKSADYEKSIIKQHFIIENQKDDVNKNKNFIELDKLTINYYTQAVDEGDVDKAFGYGIQAIMQKTRLLLIKYAQELKSYSIAERLAKHFDINLPSRFSRPEKTEQDLPSRFSRPEKTEQDLPKLEDEKYEVKMTLKKIKKENDLKPDPPINPFSKNLTKSKDLFDALSYNAKRKLENPTPSIKKYKK